jgi:hypothetical protein
VRLARIQPASKQVTVGLTIARISAARSSKEYQNWSTLRMQQLDAIAQGGVRQMAPA